MPFSNPNPTWPASTIFAVTPSDTVVFTQGEVRQLYVGVAGNVTVLTSAGTTVLFSGVNAGTTIGPFFITRVNTTGTTATGIVAFT